MQLLIFRHGIAEPTGPDGTDASRRLTEEGVERTRRAAVGLASIADRPDVVLTSPLVRAVQTSEIVGRVFNRPPTVMQELAYGPARAVIERLKRREEQIVMIVGHEPTLSGIIRTLCGGRDEGSFVVMKKAGCALVDTPISDPEAIGESRLLWLTTSKVLRRLAR